MKDLTQRNRIHQMDCIKGMKKMRSEVDVIVTSPPYNIGVRYNLYDDRKTRNEYLSWMNEVANVSKKVLNENGSFFLNIGGTLSDPWIPLDVAQEFRKNGYILQNLIHWIKSIALPKECMGNYPHNKSDIAVGHYKPINSKRYHHDCQEFIFHFTKTGNVELDKLSIGVPYQDKSNIRRWKSANGDKRDRGNTWFIPYKTIQESRPHPSSFPIKLPEMCLKDHGLNKIDLVLDPFMGIGTTALACIQLNKDYIGFEIDESYISIANERISKFHNEKIIPIEKSSDLCRKHSISLNEYEGEFCVSKS